MEGDEFYAALDELKVAYTTLAAAIARLSNVRYSSVVCKPQGKYVPSDAPSVANILPNVVHSEAIDTNRSSDSVSKGASTIEAQDLPSPVETAEIPSPLDTARSVPLPINTADFPVPPDTEPSCRIPTSMARNVQEDKRRGKELWRAALNSADRPLPPDAEPVCLTPTSQESHDQEEKSRGKELWRAAINSAQMPSQANAGSHDNNNNRMGKAMNVMKIAGVLSRVRSNSGCVLRLRGIWKQGDQETIDGVAQQITVQVSQQSLGRQSNRSKQEDATEVVDHGDTQPRCPVDHPARSRRLVWNAICLALIIWDVLSIPMGVFGGVDSLAILIVEWFCTVYWTVDMVYNFRTGYFVGSQLEMEPRAIAFNYATTWLALDLIIVVMEWVGRFSSVSAPASLLRSTRILRTLRFVKLIRLVKMRTLWVHVAQQFSSNTFILLCNMTVMTVALMVLVHLMACTWYAIGESRDDGWTSYVEYQGEKNTPFWYVASQRWVIAQLNGRTDLHDKRNMVERGFTVFVGITMAVIAKAIFTSIITKTLLELSNVASDKNRRKRAVNDYLEAHYLSTMLTTSVKHYAQEYRAKGAETEKEKMVLAILPPHIQNDLLVEVRSPRLLKHSLFLAMGNEAQRTMRRICTTALHLVSASTCEVLFCKGDPADRMLFVDKGKLTYGEPLVVDEDYDNFTKIQWKSDSEVSLGPGGWICEPSLWVEWLTKGRLVSDDYSNLLELEAKTLHQVLKDDRHEYARTVLYAVKFVAELSRESDLSDLIFFEITAKREEAGRRLSAISGVSLSGTSRARKSVFGQFSGKRN